MKKYEKCLQEKTLGGFWHLYIALCTRLHTILIMKENTRSLFISAYLRFLELASAVDALPGMDFFDPNHKALFEAILLSWSQGRAMTVREAIGRAELGSPATLHKRLVRLRQAELVTVEFIEGDRRSKLLVPTEKGLDYVSKFGCQLAQLSVASTPSPA